MTEYTTSLRTFRATAAAPRVTICRANDLQPGDAWDCPVVYHDDGTPWAGGWQRAVYSGKGNVILLRTLDSESRLHAPIVASVALPSEVERTGVLPPENEVFGGPCGDRYEATREEAEQRAWDDLRWTEYNRR